MVEKDFKKDQVREERHKLFRKLRKTNQYQMGWWSWCHNEYVLMHGSLEVDPSDQQTKSRAVVYLYQAGEGHEDEDKDGVE